SEVTVGSLAKVLGMPPEKLLEQLAGAGMAFSGPEQVVSSTEKMKLLGFLRRTHGKDDKPAEAAAPKQITLKRRKVEELTVSAGKAKTTVNVEVRQKRTYMKRDQADAPPATTEHEEVLRKLAEAKARQQAELDALDEGDRKRKLEEIARKELEAAAAAAAADASAVVAAADGDGRPNKHTPRPHKADMPRDAKPAPAKGPVNKPPARTPDKNAAVKHKARGSHAMVDNEGEDGSTPLFVTGQLHLTADERARRTSAGARKKTKARPAEQARTSTGAHGFSRPTAPIQREVYIGDNIMVAELANKLAMKGSEVVRALFKMGM